MRDFDFDELDRAVASVIDGADDKKVPEPATNVSAEADAPVESSKSIDGDLGQKSTRSSYTPSHSMHAKPSSSGVSSRLGFSAPTPSSGDTTSIEEESASEPVSMPAASPAARRRRIPHNKGRHMDMVAKPRAKKSHGNTLQPLASAQDLEEGRATTLAPETSAPETSAPETSEPKEVSGLAAAMDALLAGENPSDTSAAVVPTPAPELPADDAPSVEALPESAEPVAVSPFLTGTKVEKRPLGGRAETAETPELTPAPETPAPEEVDESAMQELSAIESGFQPVTPLPETDSLEPETLEPETSALETSAPIPKPTPEPETEAPKPTGPTSIARQYKAPQKVASEDDETGAIFDAQSYAQPIVTEEAKKKSSPWVWVIIVVVSMLIGAAVGAFMWLEGVPVPL